MRPAVVAGWVVDVEDGRRKTANGGWQEENGVVADQDPAEKLQWGTLLPDPAFSAKSKWISTAIRAAARGELSTVLEAFEGFIGGTDHCLFCLETTFT